MNHFHHYVAALAMLSISFSAGANEIACFWQPSQGTITDPAAREAAKFYSKPVELAYFRVILDRERVENADPHKTQEIIFPTLRLAVYPERFSISAPNPNMSGLNGRNAQIHVDINRYTLRSTMVLEMSPKTGGRTSGLWLRDGQCFKKEL